MTYGEAFVTAITALGFSVLAATIVFVILPPIIRGEPGAREYWGLWTGAITLFLGVPALLAVLIWWAT